MVHFIPSCGFTRIWKWIKVSESLHGIWMIPNFIPLPFFQANVETKFPARSGKRSESPYDLAPNCNRSVLSKLLTSLADTPARSHFTVEQRVALDSSRCSTVFHSFGFRSSFKRISSKARPIDRTGSSCRQTRSLFSLSPRFRWNSIRSGRRKTRDGNFVWYRRNVIKREVRTIFFLCNDYAWYAWLVTIFSCRNFCLF